MKINPKLGVILLSLFLLALLPFCLQLGLSSDDFGMAWRFLTLGEKGLLSSELWSDPHYNRFPLNTSFLYWTHIHFLRTPWLAHFFSWWLVCLVAGILYHRFVRAKNGFALNSNTAALATFFFLTSHPAWQSWVDLTCTHYFLCLFFFLIALTFYESKNGFLISALCCGLSCLCSENGVFLTLQLILLNSAETGERPISVKKILWLLTAFSLFLISKLIIFSLYGARALFWHNYPIVPADWGLNILKAIEILSVDSRLLATGLCLVFLALLLKNTIHKKNPDQNSMQLLGSFLFCASLLLSLFPFILFGNESLTARLFTSTALMLILWTPLVRKFLVPWKPLLPLTAAALLIMQLVGFAFYFVHWIHDGHIFNSFLRAAPNSLAASGAFEKQLVLEYKTIGLPEAVAPWGLPLLVNDPTLRKHFFDWKPLTPEQHIVVAVYFKDVQNVCSKTPEKVLNSKLSVFSEEPITSKSEKICDMGCQNCSELPVTESFALTP